MRCKSREGQGVSLVRAPCWDMYKLRPQAIDLLQQHRRQGRAASVESTAFFLSQQGGSGPQRLPLGSATRKSDE
jgi:hypothetical protein